jgi:uncharacterized membrane protein
MAAFLPTRRPDAGDPGDGRILPGAIAWWQTGIPAFLIGALLILAPWPWTLLVIKPVNDALMAADPAKAGPETRALLQKWGTLHAVRTLLGALAVVSFLFAVSAG